MNSTETLSLAKATVHELNGVVSRVRVAQGVLRRVRPAASKALQ